MAKVHAILDLFCAPSLGVITEKRNFASATFLGRYGLGDFMLSNFSNSGIDRMAILVDKYISTVRAHIQNGSIFINNTRIGGLDLLYDESAILKPQFNNDIRNITANISYFEDHPSDYVLIAPPNILMSYDFNPLIKHHIKSGNEITLLYQHRSDLKKSFINQSMVYIQNGTVSSVKKNEGDSNLGDVSLGIYVMNTKTFLELVKEQPLVSQKYSIKDMINYYIKKHKKVVGAYEYEGYCLPIFNFQDYVDVSFELLPYENRLKFFKEGWPIYTTTHNTPPVLYGAISEVRNSFIANGCVINGKVENSVISRGVVIKEDAVVKNCILFTNTVVEKGVKLDYVLSEKKSVILPKGKAHYRGTKKEMLIIRQGTK